MVQWKSISRSPLVSFVANFALWYVLVSCLHAVLAEIEPQPQNNDEDFPDVGKNDDVLSGTVEDKDKPKVGDVGFIHGFVASFSVIIVSELGDKTFFIAAIMAMKHARVTVFAGAIAALILQTVLSALFGQLAQLVPRVYTYYISTALFAFFGLKMLKEGYYMKDSDAQEELEEVQSDIKKREDQLEQENRAAAVLGADPETAGKTVKVKPSKTRVMLRVFVQAFTMTFLAEWGDRSQLATIILAARDNVWGVIVGGIIGHTICTGIAVIGGRIIAQKISVRTVTIIGGVVFLIFAVSSLFFDPNEEAPPDV